MLSLERQNALREVYRQTHPGWRPATEVYAGLVREHLRPSVRLLDLGCGRGGLVEQLAHPLHQMVGVDPDFASLVEHRLLLPRAAGQTTALPFAPNCFDLILASWVLEHLAEPQRAWREIGRVLRPGGHLVFITPNRRHPLVQMNRLLGRVGWLQGRLVRRLYGRAAVDTFPAYYRANTAGGLVRLATTAGLQVMSVQTIADPTYWAWHLALFRLAGAVEAWLPAGWGIHLVGVMQKAETP
ncbi:MAG: class I SAM-dependent methyltransferase [Chloroflexota bacterium]